MIHRLRMARKRLGIARERARKSGSAYVSDVRHVHVYEKPAWFRMWRRYDTLRAIERRKERIA